MAKQSSSSVAYNEIIKNIKQRKFSPVYLLMGDESYYIDRITDCIASTVLPEEEQAFNQVTIYCTRDTDFRDIINTSRRYPMMSEYQVVIVKEAQNLQKIDELLTYIQNPLNTTILVISYKNGLLDKRKKIVPAIAKVGVVFESMKLKETSLPTFITSYLQERGVTIEQAAVMMLVENIGTDLSRMTGELDKLIITLSDGSKIITPEQIERNIGISREFNLWELKTAIVNKDIYKANLIINYFCSNPKNNPAVTTVAMLFNLFAQIMQAYYAPVRTADGIAKHLEMQPWAVRDLITAMHNYSAMKTMQIIAHLRETDVRLKGVDRGNLSEEDVMKELIFYILH